MDGTPTRERRIGDRRAVDPLEISWRVADAKQTGRGLFRRRHAGGSDRVARLVDVSVSGAAIEAPYEKDLLFGQKVRIAHEGLEGVVAIRRAVPTDRADIAVYGVEFVQMDAGLTRRLHELIEQERPEGLEDAWLRAT
jgi:hypothetical protein